MTHPPFCQPHWGPHSVTCTSLSCVSKSINIFWIPAQQSIPTQGMPRTVTAPFSQLHCLVIGEMEHGCNPFSPPTTSHLQKPSSGTNITLFIITFLKPSLASWQVLTQPLKYFFHCRSCLGLLSLHSVPEIPHAYDFNYYLWTNDSK